MNRYIVLSLTLLFAICGSSHMIARGGGHGGGRHGGGGAHHGGGGRHGGGGYHHGGYYGRGGYGGWGWGAAGLGLGLGLGYPYYNNSTTVIETNDSDDYSTPEDDEVYVEE